MHFVGQSTIFTLKGDGATGEAYCIAHHLHGAWLFAERLLYVDWLEGRALSVSRKPLPRLVVCTRLDNRVIGIAYVVNG
jgi:hypothetical protein